MSKYNFYSEIFDQPQTWEQVITNFGKEKHGINSFLNDYNSYIFSGCGSGFNVSSHAKNLGEFLLKKQCSLYQSSEIKFFHDSIYKKWDGEKPLTILFSRSGDTTEVVDAVKALQGKDLSDIFGITCSEDSFLYNNVNYSFSLQNSKEKAVVTTKSFTAMALISILLLNEISDICNYIDNIKELPAMGEKVIRKYEDMARDLGESMNIDSYYFLSNTPNIGLAREAKLKLLEMTLVRSDYFNMLDFRHGPQAVVDQNTLITIFLSDKGIDYEYDLASEMKQRGANLMIFGDIVPKKFYSLTENIVEVGTRLPDFIRGILYLPVVHFLSYYKAVKIGLDPDKPKNLTYYVEVKNSGGK